MKPAPPSPPPPPTTSPFRPPLTQVEGLIPCCGFVCFFASLYFLPTCFGCMSRDACCCIFHEDVICKRAAEKGVDCIMCKSETVQTTETVHCCYCMQQCFCVDLRYSLTQSREQPCMMNALFWTCFFDNQPVCRFCASIDSLEKQVVKNQQKKVDKAKRFKDLIHNEAGPNRPVSGLRSSMSSASDIERPLSGLSCLSDFSYSDG